MITEHIALPEGVRYFAIHQGFNLDEIECWTVEGRAISLEAVACRHVLYSCDDFDEAVIAAEEFRKRAAVLRSLTHAD